MRWYALLFACSIDIEGEFDEIVNINGTVFSTGVVDGTTGIYTCEVCRDRDTRRELCVNSSVPIIGRRKWHEAIGICTSAGFIFLPYT